jgi:hypothetical protein
MHDDVKIGKKKKVQVRPSLARASLINKTFTDDILENSKIPLVADMTVKFG